MLRCPFCHRVDDELRERGYCSHCGEDVSAKQIADAADPAVQTSVAIRCPECGQLSDSIKCYRMGLFLFVLVAWYSSTKNEFGCPSCIRGKIAKFSVINLFASNVLWPFVILPWTIILLLMSFTKGHSREVRNAIRESTEGCDG